MRSKVKDLLASLEPQNGIIAKGWVRTFRNNQFVALNDGSTIHNIQCVVDFENTPDEILKRITTGAAISVIGDLVESQGAGQKWEIQVKQLEILGDSDPEKFPMQPKRHSLEFLRENAHLRVRTNAFGAIMRVRSVLAFAVHQYFQEKGFVYVNTPIITGADAEGAGEMFQVTSLPLDNLPKNDDGSINYKEDFFGKHTNLTVSGQLEGETFAMALGQIYTFGPTFRAENSNTSRHLAEFWMIEPEVAFNDLDDNMDLAEDFIRYVIGYAVQHCKDDLTFLNQRLADEEKQKPQDQRSSMSLLEKLDFVLNNNFKRVSYTEAIDIL
ncbi:MAG TPA: asparagine--tRNA ligase, partial [Flavobacterium sp.]|nr:asparagine--tRNA ligase [Flavobacterium sp.]